jgi:YgiT-type zinc finger domain-containing protein
VICRHGENVAGVATVTLQRGESTVIIKGVPADICDNCAEYYLNEAVTEEVRRTGGCSATGGSGVGGAPLTLDSIAKKVGRASLPVMKQGIFGLAPPL